MYTPLFLLALAGSMGSSTAAEPVWLKDYNLARKQGKLEQKPLVVVVGNGKSGWNQISQEGKLGKEIKELLSNNYVCVYVDTNNKKGSELASAFEIEEGSGLVISDQTGSLQAFRHEGGLPNQELAQQLKKFSDPELVVDSTEKASVIHTSYYLAPAQDLSYPSIPSIQPNFAPSFAPAGGGCRT